MSETKSDREVEMPRERGDGTGGWDIPTATGHSGATVVLPDLHYAMVVVEDSLASLVIKTGSEIARQVQILVGNDYGWVLSITRIGDNVEARRY